jgi:hypothetical protein
LNSSGRTPTGATIRRFGAAATAATGLGSGIGGGGAIVFTAVMPRSAQADTTAPVAIISADLISVLRECVVSNALVNSTPCPQKVPVETVYQSLALRFPEHVSQTRRFAAQLARFIDGRERNGVCPKMVNDN